MVAVELNRHWHLDLIDPASELGVALLEAKTQEFFQLGSANKLWEAPNDKDNDDDNDDDDDDEVAARQVSTSISENK